MMGANNTNTSLHRRTRHGKKLWLFICVALTLLSGISQVLPVYAAPGDLDSTFSGDGLQTTDFFGGVDVSNGVAIQSDGKIVVGGYASNGASNYDFALARYNTNGNLDNNFDLDGKVTTDFQGNNDLIGDVAIQSNGKILAAGTAVTAAGGYDFAVARYNSDGSPDNTFSGNGRRVTDILGDEEAVGLAIQADGKIVLVGGLINANSDFILARYNSNGTLDTSFSGDGVLATDFGSRDFAFEVAIQPDGKLVVVGYTDATGNMDFAVARYNTDGSLDNTFSSDGLATVDFSGSSDTATDVLIQPDGKILVTGQVLISDFNFGLARLLADGTLDSTFSGNGKVNTDFGDDETACKVLLQPDSKLVVVGASASPPYRRYGTAGGGATNFAVARYRPSGALDNTFSDDGKVLTAFGGATGAALQSDNKIVAAGATG